MQRPAQMTGFSRRTGTIPVRPRGFPRAAGYLARFNLNHAMHSFCDIETDQMQAHRAALPPANPPPSRLAALLQSFSRHAGAIAVDHTHLPPLDKISGRSGNFHPPPRPNRCC